MSTFTIDIRRAGSKDASSIAAVHDASWREAYSGIIPAKALQRMVQRRGVSWWATALRRGVEILVLEVGDDIVGYATMGRNRVATLDYDAEIYEIYLKPEYQGLGFGRRLFQATRQALASQGRKRVIVWALSDNERAEAFYHGLGGRAVATGHEAFDGEQLEKCAYAWH
ncbi:MAG: GNAT family N-acetyltransferase [Pseudomonadota bacterium]